MRVADGLQTVQYALSFVAHGGAITSLYILYVHGPLLEALYCRSGTRRSRMLRSYRHLIPLFQLRHRCEKGVELLA